MTIVKRVGVQAFWAMRQKLILGFLLPWVEVNACALLAKLLSIK